MRVRRESDAFVMSEPLALVLRIVGGAMAGARFRLTEPTVTVGRSPACAISITDPSLSRTHFELISEGGVWRVTDLDSRNGIAVNGKLTLRAVVRPGDEIRAGDM